MDSRSALDYTSKYPPVARALRALKRDVVFDGEVVVFNEEGTPDFDALQNFNGHETPIRYCIFDILWLDGYSLTHLPLTERKSILKQLIGENEVLRLSESFDDGPALYQEMLTLNLEGIVSKKRDSVYAEGERAHNWLKTPTRKRQEFVIGGWAESDRGRAFRSLLFGAYNNGNLEWIGRSGGGYKEKDMPAILKQLKALEISASPFTNKVLDTKGAIMHWVKPKLVANFEFATWTKSGRIRKPATFLGFRKDKKPGDVVREVPSIVDDVSAIKGPDSKVTNSAPRVKTAKRAGGKQSKPKYLNSDSNWKLVDREQASAEWIDFEMENCTIPVHDADREIWQQVSKGRLLLYYSEMADIILPYLRDRPQSLVLKLSKAGGPRTFIKDMEGREPDCADVFIDQRRVKKAGKRNEIHYLVCNNKETLIYMIDLGCVDINAWASRKTNINNPDYLWLDLDPTLPEGLKGKKSEVAENNGFVKATEVAIAAKAVLDKHKLTGFVKTSGQTGIHIYVPCSGYSFEETRLLATRLGDDTHTLTSNISTRQESVILRGDKLYIDTGQNDYADTLAAPYCIRPYHAPLVSTPLEWKELKKSPDRYSFNLDTIQSRLHKKGDLFSGVMDSKIIRKNNASLKKLLKAE